MQVVARDYPVDIFHDNLVRENVAELSQEELNLITTLWLQDLDDVDFGRKKKAREDQPVDDNTLAFNYFARELENYQASVRDAQLARSVAAALDSDRGILGELVREEQLARRDRQMALEIDRRENPSRPASAMSNRSTLVGSDTSKTLFHAPSVASGSPRISRPPVSMAPAPPSPRVTAECAVCNERTTQFIRLPCNDAYCIPCLRKLFEHAIKDESLMPPRCCRKEIPFNLVASHLPILIRHQFTRKLEEHNTLNRLYCVQPSCSAFLGSADGARRSVQCLDCGSRVCTACKKEGHPSYVACKEDEETEQTIEFCREQGWQRCPGCQRMIELAHGCYHMTCLCRSQFCYLCRVEWKNCRCPQWDEDRLVAAAQDRVLDEVRRPQVPRQFYIPDPPAPAAAIAYGSISVAGTRQTPMSTTDMHNRVRNMVEHLRENHACKHPGWSTEMGPAQCESCFHRLDRFILRCHGCRMRACVRCRRNRL